MASVKAHATKLECCVGWMRDTMCEAHVVRATLTSATLDICKCHAPSIRSSARTCLKHMLVPATAATAQGKHQPLLWKRGWVQRYTQG